MFKILMSILLISFFAYGKEIVIKNEIPVEITIKKPEKSIFYLKEPVYLSFTVKSKSQKIYDFIDIKPEKSEGILFKKRKKINRDFVEYNFVLFFTEKAKKVDFVFTVLSKIYSHKEKVFSLKNITVLPIPDNIPYVGDFSIQIKTETKNNTALITLSIQGKGYPLLPEHTLSVINGSGKKIYSNFYSDFDKVFLEERFKVFYPENLKVEPVEFSFFDPFIGKVKKIKTDIFYRKEDKKEIWSEEKVFNIFKKNYPEFFLEKKPVFKLKDLLEFAVYIPLFLIFTIGILFLYIIFFGKNLLPADILFIIHEKNKGKIYLFLSTKYYDIVKNSDLEKKSRWDISKEILKKYTEDLNVFKKNFLFMVFYLLKHKFLVIFLLTCITVIFLIYKMEL